MRYKVCHVVAIFEKREDRMQASVFFISLNGKSSLFHCTLWIFRVISDEIKQCTFQKIALDVFDSPRFIDVKNNFSKSDVIYYFKDYYENLQNTLKLKKLFSLFSYSFLHSYNCIQTLISSTRAITTPLYFIPMLQFNVFHQQFNERLTHLSKQVYFTDNGSEIQQRLIRLLFVSLSGLN